MSSTQDHGTYDSPFASPFPGGDVLAAHPDDAPARRVPWLLAGGVGLLVLALVAGVTYGVGALSGGGSQPESALPGGAFAFVKVDLDPSAGQKIDGFRFLRQFPALRDDLSSDDLRKVLFEELADGAGWDSVDFDSQVGPWLGQRLAVAAYPPPAGQQPRGVPAVVVALQVTDEDAAREGLARLARLATSTNEGRGAPGFVVEGDYALLAEDQRQAERAAEDADGGTLDQDGVFARDLADGGDGVMAAWVDAGRMTEALGDIGGGLGMLGAPGVVGGVSGRSTYVARFDGPDVFELSGTVRDTDTAGWTTRSAQGLGDLPATSVVALALADGDELFTRTFAAMGEAMAASAGGPNGPGFDTMVADAEQELGIEIPEDLAVLFGDNLVGALDGGGRGRPDVGVRVTTDAERAERVLAAVTRAAGNNLPLVRRRVGEDIVVATTRAQVERLSDGAGATLGDEPAFDRALPDLAGAGVAVWVDPKGVMTGLFAEEGPVDENLKPIEGIGMTVSSQDDTTATFRLRVVTS